jgi:4-amino-4-deoxy-L-arabinose transferase-like glycosyltransferase
MLLLCLALTLAWSAGILGRGYWTPDEPREADIAWRMSWQPHKAVPLLAGEAFCEKPPLTYWVAGAAIRVFGKAAWAARLPNLLYALMTAVGVGLLARRAAGSLAGWAAAAAIGTFLLSYQTSIWLATDAPLLAAVSVALLGAYRGFYAEGSADRLRGYTLMHAALAIGFLSKSAAAWMVPVLTLATLTVWERRWRELLRWELYAGLALQAAVILSWVWFVYRGEDGVEHLKVFFWNNLAGRFAHVDAPQDLQYAAGHRNSPGKYLVELPTYLWPWIFLVAAAARRAWLARRSWVNRGAAAEVARPVRFAVASIVPTLALLSVAATARNVYLSPAMPGFALLVGWWMAESVRKHDAWDLRAVRVTAALLLLAVLGFAVGLAIVGFDISRGTSAAALAGFAAVGAIGVIAAAILAFMAEAASRRGRMRRAPYLLTLAYCLLLALPAPAIYRGVDTWQNLPAIGRTLGADSSGGALILMAPDETTRAMVDMYARTDVELIKGPVDDQAILRLRELTAARPNAFVVAQWPGRQMTPTVQRIAHALGIPLENSAPLERAEPPWVAAADLKVVHLYALPNGRRYAMLQRAG